MAKTSSQQFPTFRYYFNISFPNLQPLTAFGGTDLQAYHSSEIPLVFGNLPPNSTADEIALSQTMQTAWANFAKSPANGPGFQAVDASGNDVANYGGIDPTGEVIISESSIDSRCPLFDPIYQSVTAPAFKK